MQIVVGVLLLYCCVCVCVCVCLLQIVTKVDIEDVAEDKAYCRCWKSKTVSGRGIGSGSGRGIGSGGVVIGSRW